MSYTPTNWIDGETPVNAANMNKLEDAVASISRSGGGGGLSMSLLWENASTTSDFAEQTITLDLSPYDIIAVLGDGVHAFISHPFTAGKEGVMSNWVAWGTGLSYQHSCRLVAVSADGAGLAFGPGRLIRQSTGSVENNNTVAKPQKIYGIKGVTA